MAEASGPSVREIAEALRQHAESIGFMLFPNARKAGGFLNIGSLHGEPGDSLKLRLTGAKMGTWADYAESESDPRGKGDMLKLLQYTVGGGDLGRGVAEAKKFLNIDSMDPRALERMRLQAAKAQARAARSKASDDERKRANAAGLWQAASPLTPSSPVVRYLEGRGIDFARLGKLPGAIRYHHRVIHAETSEQRGQRTYLPAMVTRFNALAGDHAATHVTFLHYSGADGWVKLPPLDFEREDPETGEVTAEAVNCAKKIFSPLYWGAHMALRKGAQERTLRDILPGAPVWVSEGIEDGLSYAMANPEARIVAAGTLGNIGQLALPPQAGTLKILAQNDSKPEPVAALEDAIRKQQLQAREQGSARTIEQLRPPQDIKDWNDWLREGTE